jgi:hypothetical protein
MMLQPIGVSADRSVIGYANVSGFQPSTGRDTLDVFEIKLDGENSRRIARLPGELRDHARGFGPTPVITNATNGFWFGTGEAYEIGRYNRDATLLRIARMPYTPIPVTAEMIAQAKARNAETSARLGVKISERTFAAHLPPYSVVLSDSEDNIWIRPFGTGHQAVWNVLNPNGQYLGDVTLPDGSIPFQIGADFILARAWDEYRLEYVRVYRLAKP